MRHNNGETSVNGYNRALFRFYQCSLFQQEIAEIDGSAAKLRKRPLFPNYALIFSRVFHYYLRARNRLLSLQYLCLAKLIFTEHDQLCRFQCLAV